MAVTEAKLSYALHCQGLSTIQGEAHTHSNWAMQAIGDKKQKETERPKVPLAAE